MDTLRGLTHLWTLPTSAPRARADRRLEPLTEAVLAARGLDDSQVSLEFLNPTLRQLHDPSLMHDLDRAAERLLAAARAREPIVIYGDYDVDGTSATAILYHMLRAIAPEAEIRTYIPHRLDEGYGLSTHAITHLVAEGARVIVSVDCGITAIEPALAANAAGVDLIITDHHNLDADRLPNAYAVVHPRHPESRYPFADLCGAGVAYKLAWRLATMHTGASKVSEDLRALMLDLLALASLGVVADVVPLLGENRVMARFGLGCIRTCRFPGVRALVEASGLSREDIDAYRVGFILSPRLNACGRMGHARDAVELLTTHDPARAKAIAALLTTLNNERRATEQAITAQACELAEAAGMTTRDRRAIVLAHEDWHTGVIGIVCSRLVERYARPVVLMQHQADVCAGSGRSIGALPLHHALTRCAQHLETFGGHDYAAGLRLRTCNLDAFTDAFISHANANLAPDQLAPTLRIDCDAALADITRRAVTQLERLAPFGRDNPRVTVRVSDVEITGQPKRFGREGGHLGIHVRQNECVMRLIAWNWGDRAEGLRAGQRIDAVVTPAISRWNGVERLEPELQDLRSVTS